MNFKAFLFDLDGTLGDTLPIVVEALQDTFKRFSNHEYSPIEIAAMFGPTEEGVIRPRVTTQDFPAALQYYLDRYAFLHKEADQPFPGIINLLDLLRRNGIRRGVVTGKGRNTAEISLHVMGLTPFIEILETGSEAGAEKPEAMQRILSNWDIKPEEAVYVGDMPYDMCAAQEAGLLPLGACWAATATVKSEEGPAFIFYTVEELIEWVIKESSDEFRGMPG
jgi:pyrophosphatase PpaX